MESRKTWPENIVYIKLTLPTGPEKRRRLVVVVYIVCIPLLQKPTVASLTNYQIVLLSKIGNVGKVQTMMYVCRRVVYDQTGLLEEQSK